MEWVRTFVLANALGKTERSVQRLALRQGWRFREMPCRGGMRREYHLPSLSQEIRRKVAAYFEQQQVAQGRQLQEAALQQAQASAQEAGLNGLIEARAAEEKEKERIRLECHQQSLAEFHQLPQWQQQCALCKWEILKAYEHFVRENRLPLKAGQDLFVNEYNILRIAVEDRVREIYPEIHVSSLRRWIDEEHEHGLLGLIDRYGHRKGTGRIDQDPHLQRLILGYFDQIPHIRNTHLLQEIHANHPQYRDLTISTLSRWFNAWKEQNAQYVLLRTRPSRWRHNTRVAFGDADADIVRLNQLWEMDSTPADVMLQDGRHHVLAAIDVYSRRLKLLVSKTSKATMVGTLLRRALLAWGVPEVVRIDNGKEYVSHYLERLLRDLAITPDWCRPCCPEEKPFIEVAIKTFCYGILELKPDYIGHSVAERKALQDREAFMRRMFKRGEEVSLQMTAADLQTFCDDWCAAVYGRDPHQGLEGHQSPFERATAWREPIKRIADERALDILLAPVPRHGGIRVVEPKGIAIEQGWYISDALIPHINQRVYCRWDPDDIGKIYVFGGRELSAFIAIAVCPRRADLSISLKEAALAAHARQKEFLQEVDHQVKEARRAISQADPAQAVIDYRKEQAAQVVELPHRSVPYQTPALQEAAAAVRAAERLHNPPVATISAEDREKARCFIEQVQESIEAPPARYKRLMKLESHTPEEEAWMQDFEDTPEGRGLLKFLEMCQENERLIEQWRVKNATA